MLIDKFARLFIPKILFTYSLEIMCDTIWNVRTIVKLGTTISLSLNAFHWKLLKKHKRCRTKIMINTFSLILLLQNLSSIHTDSLNIKLDRVASTALTLYWKFQYLKSTCIENFTCSFRQQHFSAYTIVIMSALSGVYIWPCSQWMIVRTPCEYQKQLYANIF